MKHTLLALLSVLSMVCVSCKSDEPEVSTDKGQLIVNLVQDDAQGDDIDFSDYTVAIVPESGFIPTAPIKEIIWPVDVLVGTYTIAAASPQVSETATTESWYYGEVKNVKIQKDQTTEVTVHLTLTEYPKNL